MPKFSYIVKDSNGKTIADVTDGYDKSSIVKSLQEKGFFVVSIQEITAKKSQTGKQKAKVKKKFSHKKIKLDDMLIFANQLSTMLGAGVTLLRSLDVIVSQIESENLEKVARKVRDDVEQGSSLSMALEKHPKVFNQFWVSLIEVGEASGTMPTILKKLAFYLQQQAAFKATILSAIIYPAVLFFVSCGAVMFFAFWVMPRFESIFETLGSELPLITKLLLAVFDFLKRRFLILAALGAGIYMMFKKYIATYRGGLNFERFIFSLPTFGKVFKLIVIERFTSQMAILINSGVPILHALDIAQRMVSNRTCALIINSIKEGVREGQSLTKPMEDSGFFPSMATQMITVGEETGELGGMLQHVADFYQENVEIFMKRFGTIIEPIMLIFMGAVIGVIVLAMFLPMFNMSSMGG